jgi:hypothetical protein
MIYRFFWALIAFVFLEVTGFGDKFVEKNLIVMRLLLVFTVITFLIIILTTILQYPPVGPGNYLIILVMGCALSVYLVLMISTITAVIVFIIWTIALSAMAFQQEQITTYVSGSKMFKFVTEIMFMLFLVLVLFVALEIAGLFVEKHFFAVRFVLVLAVFTFLVIIIPYVLQNPHVCDLLQTMVLMVMSCVVCVLLVALISTVTAVIVFIIWMVGIMTIVVKMWDDLVQQMKAIRNVVANKF